MPPLKTFAWTLSRKREKGLRRRSIILLIEPVVGVTLPFISRTPSCSPHLEKRWVSIQWLWWLGTTNVSVTHVNHTQVLQPVGTIPKLLPGHPVSVHSFWLSDPLQYDMLSWRHPHVPPRVCTFCHAPHHPAPGQTGLLRVL